MALSANFITWLELNKARQSWVSRGRPREGGSKHIPEGREERKMKGEISILLCVNSPNGVSDGG